MKSIIRFVAVTAPVLLTGAAVFLMAADSPTIRPGGLAVHEWGTFTSVASESGGSEPWTPLAGPSDLPCFVAHLHGKSYKSIVAPTTKPFTETVTVRMETPVLYFYSPRKTTVSVHVDFPRGLITEWYPGATKVSPEADLTLPPVGKGQIDWDSVEVTPGENPALLAGRGASHYYAARNTDADPIRVGSEREKLIFYRGIANLAMPLRAMLIGDGKVELRNTEDAALTLAILFENRGGKVGYRVARGLTGAVQVDTPELDGDLGRVKQELANNLVAMGLFPKEADAMIATWSDSWFEEGMRVFYLVPRGMVDDVLPLTIKPAPVSLERVFVGRVEVLSPFMRKKLETALAAGDTSALDKFGRFLGPFLRQVKESIAPSVANYLSAKSAEAQREFFSPSCVQ